MTSSFRPPFSTHAHTIDSLLQLGRFTPASVQRGFEWNQEEAGKLLDDLDSAFSVLRQPTDAPSDEEEPAADLLDAAEEGPAHNVLADLEEDAPPPAFETSPPLDCFYLGSMVLVDTGGERIDIFDGLQRITTLTLLFCVLRDLTEDPAFRARMQALVRGADGYRLTLPGREPTLIRDAQESDSVFRVRRVTATRDVGKRLQSVKNLFLEQLRNWTDERRRRFGEFVLESAWVSAIMPSDPRLARQIFVSTNLLGKRLKPISVLKGQIGDLASSEPEEREIKELWTRVESDLGDEFAALLRAIDMIERTEQQGVQWPTDLGEHLAEIVEPGAAGQWMRRLYGYSRTWLEMQRILRDGGQTPIERNLWRLGAFPWQEWRPLALFLWRQKFQAERSGRLNGWLEQRFDRIFDRLHRRCMALTLADSVGARRKSFVKAIGQAKRGVDPTSYGNRRKSETVDGALLPLQSGRRKIDRMLEGQMRQGDLWAPLVKWLEMAQWREGLPALMADVTAEHVLPRNPENTSEERPKFHSQEEYDRCCYSLGNLDAQPKKVNFELGNSDYQAKRAVLREQARQFVTLVDIVEHDTWGPVEIDARAERLREAIRRELGFRAA